MNTALLKRWLRRNLYQKIWTWKHSIAFLFSLSFAYFYPSYLSQTLEPLLLNKWFAMRGKIEAPKKIVLIEMNEQSFAREGKSTYELWPRELTLKLIKRLKEYQVERIVFDSVFLYEGPDPKVDKKIAESLKEVPAVLGSFFVSAKYNKEKKLSGKFERSLKLFSNSAESEASLRLKVEKGFYIRHFSLPIFNNMQPLSRAALGERASKLTRNPGRADFINYYGPPGTISHFLFHDLADDNQLKLAPMFKDKLVFVGMVFSDSDVVIGKDSFRTPASPETDNPMFGVEIHATQTANLLESRWISRFSVLKECLFGALFLYFWTLVILSIKPVYGIIVSLFTVICWGVFSYISFLSLQFIPFLSFLIIFCPLGIIVSSLFYYTLTRLTHKELEESIGVDIPLNID